MLNERRRKVILKACEATLELGPGNISYNLKRLSWMKEIASRGHFHDVEHHPEAKATLEITDCNYMAELLAGVDFIGQLKCMYMVRLGNKKRMLDLAQKDH